jgi:pyruvate/2-oxoglutarate dehydrogenase complex dihydrolipoamide dehydrogenase (E3) component
MAKHKFDYDLVVIGSGAAGAVAAEIVARAGQKVAIIEAATLGGSAPNVSDVPMGALLAAAHAFDAARRGAAFGLRTSTIGYNYPSIRNWKDLTVKRSGALATGDYLRSRGIAIFKGRAHFLSRHEISIGRRHLSADKFILATGSHSTVPNVAGLDKVDYLTPETALNLLRPPKTLGIIGAGASGVQLAELLAIFGTKVHLFEAKQRLLAEADDEVSEVLTRVFAEQRGMKIHLSSRVTAAQNDGAAVRLKFIQGATEHHVKVDRVLLAAGRTPNVDIGLENTGVEYDQTGVKADEFLTTSTPGIYAAGDVLGRVGRTHAAIYEARLAAHNSLGRAKQAADYTAMPRIVWTTPEIATVGLNEADLARQDIKSRRSLVQNAHVARANISNFAVGFAKVLTDPKGQLLGATIMAPHAAETISELGVAIHNGLAAHQVADTIHPFGSWSEVARLACAKIRV